MRATEASTLEGYVRQAEHYGTDEVFETALDEGLPLQDLGKLSLRLQNLNPQWKLTVDAQRLFVLALADRHAYHIKLAAQVAGVSLTTARMWREDWIAGNYEYVVPEDPFLALRAASKARFTDLKGIVRGWHRTTK